MHFLEKVDTFLCSKWQIPLKYYIPFLGDKRKLLYFYFLRFFGWGLYVFSEIVLQATFIYLFSKGQNYFQLAGFVLILRFMALQFVSLLTNYLTLQLRSVVTLAFKAIDNYQSIVKAHLKNEGFTDSEIGHIQNIRSIVYTSELERLFISEATKIASSISIALIMFLIDNAIWGVAILVTIWAIYYLKTNILSKQFDARYIIYNIANHSLNIPLIEKANLSHLFYTVGMNFIGFFGLALSALSLVFSFDLSTFAVYIGIGIAVAQLSTISSNLASRYENEVKIKMIVCLFELMGSKNFLISKKNIDDHLAQNSRFNAENAPKGIYIDNFKLDLDFMKGEEIQNFNLHLKPGEIAVLKAYSGKGKTTLVNAINHKVNHSGDVIFVGNRVENIHTYLKEGKIERFAKTFSVDEIDPNITVAELFNPVAKSKYKIPIRSVELDQLLQDAGQDMPFSLLSDFKNKTGGWIKDEVKKEVDKYLNFRNRYVNSTLSKLGGNLSHKKVSASRIFSTLSTGEKLRVVVGYAKCFVQTSSPKLVLIDEPFGQLDKEVNLTLQVNIIKEITNSKNPPSIIIISHQYIDRIKTELKAKVINLQ